MASIQPSRLNKALRSSSPAHIVTASNSSVKGASRPSSPRLHSSNSNHQPYPNQLRSNPTNINSIKQRHINNSITNPSSTASSRSRSSSRPTSPSPITGPSGTAIKHGHSLSAAAPYPHHTSVHPPLRLLTTATCLDTLTCLVSAQSPPHSPTFSSFALPKSNPGSTSSRANSILDGIQSALGGALSASSPPHSSGTIKSSSSAYSAAKESLADFSIAASRRSHPSHQGVPSESVGVTRSRSHYVSFPNFDEVDFVDVAMVEDDGDEDDAQDWSGPDSPPEGQHPMMDTTADNMGQSSSSSLDEKMMRPIGGGHGYERMTLGMPTSPSQHWLLQLETYHEQRVNNGVEA
ncbi:hypothetical protein KVV02_002049 [Mortierella alpina]|uniref:Uncharacterized protein n=1 Tax=Mortierella alpina TaxID=64518 RepID=A0A9P8D1S5_MORAP|nr:hypothetical protein KVV02_002049 [Mortierella alpina]